MRNVSPDPVPKCHDRSPSIRTGNPGLLPPVLTEAASLCADTPTSDTAVTINAAETTDWERFIRIPGPKTINGYQAAAGWDPVYLLGQPRRAGAHPTARTLRGA